MTNKELQEKLAEWPDDHEVLGVDPVGELLPLVVFEVGEVNIIAFSS